MEATKVKLKKSRQENDAYIQEIHQLKLENAKNNKKIKVKNTKTIHSKKKQKKTFNFIYPM